MVSSRPSLSQFNDKLKWRGIDLANSVCPGPVLASNSESITALPIFFSLLVEVLVHVEVALLQLLLAVIIVLAVVFTVFVEDCVLETLLILLAGGKDAIEEEEDDDDEGII